jgi:hypothetical protein
MEARTSEYLTDLIRRAVTASRQREGAVDPRAARGLLKAAKFHSERCNALMDRICEDAAELESKAASPTLPVRRRTDQPGARPIWS